MIKFQQEEVDDDDDEQEGSQAHVVVFSQFLSPTK